MSTESKEKLIEVSDRNVRYRLSLRIVKVLNALFMTAVFAAGWYKFCADQIASPYFAKGNYAVIFLFFVLYVTFGRIYDAFLLSYHQISEMVFSQALAFIEADAVMFIVNWLLKKYIPFVPGYLLVICGQLIIAILWSKIAHDWYFHHFKAKKTFIVWDMRRGMSDLIDSYGMAQKFNVVGSCSAEECLTDLSVLDGMDVVFISGVHSHDRNIIIKYCVERSITSFIIPRVGDVMMSGAKRMHMFHLPIMRLDRYNPSPEYLFFKRLFDIVLSVIALVIASPIMLVTAIQIRSYDGGPVFYRQCRLTKNGKKFNVLKFRSMRVDAEKDGVARLSTGENDDRITPVGRRIRAHRIEDEDIIRQTKGSLENQGLREVSPLHFSTGCNLFSQETILTAA